jgi:hypothetical protein
MNNAQAWKLVMRLALAFALNSVGLSAHLEHGCEAQNGETSNLSQGNQTHANIRSCMAKLASMNHNEVVAVNEESSSDRNEGVHLFQQTNEVDMAVVTSAITASNAATIQNLAACVREEFPEQFEHRKFEQGGGGNNVVFVAGFIQEFAPSVAMRIVQVAHLVWKSAGWSSPDPLQCGIRTAEHLSYDGWSKLGVHIDAGSLYTVLIALANPEDYEGGNFFMFPENGDLRHGKIISVKPDRLSAIVFRSETEHGVEDVQSAGREMFATELWRWGDVPMGVRRPNWDDENNEPGPKLSVIQETGAVSTDEPHELDEEI